MKGTSKLTFDQVGEKRIELSKIRQKWKEMFYGSDFNAPECFIA